MTDKEFRSAVEDQGLPGAMQDKPSSSSSQSNQSLSASQSNQSSSASQNNQFPSSSQSNQSPSASQSNQFPSSPQSNQSPSSSQSNQSSSPSQSNQSSSGVQTNRFLEPFHDKRFLSALMAFVLINLAFAPCFAGRLDRFAYPFRTWPYWLVKDLHSTTENFNVTLLGSSLMLGSIYGCDANYLKMPIDSCTYHRSTYLNDELEKTYGGKFNTFNLATPGQVPSDAYLLFKTMLSLGQKPRVVIYGIAPRDFMDNRLNKADDTETFHYLKRLVSTNDIEGEDGVSQFDRLLFQYVPLYKCAVNLKIGAAEKCDALLAAILPRPTEVPSFTYWRRVELLPEYKAGELYPGAVVHVPTKPPQGAAWKRNNVEDYIERYRHPNEQMFAQQISYLDKLLALAKAENIKIVLVNMPLSPINIALLGADRYQNFEARLAEFAQSKSIQFLNLSDQKSFPNELFEDSAHLNAYGGKLFIDRLVQGLEKDDKSNAALKSAGATLAHQGPLLSTRGARETN